jgi:repressor LexA
LPEPLTELERRVLEYMVDYLRGNTYQPSIREIGRRFGIKSTKTVAEHLQALARKGWVERDPSRSRGVRLLGLDLNPPRPAERYPSSQTVDAHAAAAAAGPTDEAAWTPDDGPPSPVLVVTASVDGPAELGIRSGDRIYAQPLGDAPLADGEALVARYGGAITAGVARRGPGGYLLWRDGHAIALWPDADPALNVIGRISVLLRDFSDSVSPST